MQLLTIIQVLAAILLIGAVLLQQRGVGLSGVFGGSGDVYRTKRGAEKTLFHITILLAFLFFGSALLGVVLG